MKCSLDWQQSLLLRVDGAVQGCTITASNAQLVQWIQAFCCLFPEDLVCCSPEGHMSSRSHALSINQSQFRVSVPEGRGGTV